MDKRVVILLFVVSILGIGLVCTQNIWVPKVVFILLPKKESPILNTISINTVPVPIANPMGAPKNMNGPQCFTAADNAYLAFRVFQDASPPTSSNDSTYANFPLTDISTEQIATLNSTQLGYGTYYHVWGNRCEAVPGSTRGDIYGCVGGSKIENQKGNELAQSSVTASDTDTFSSYKRADDCTLAQTAFALGEGLHKVYELTAGDSLKIITDSSQVSKLISLNALHDVCVMPEVPDPSVTGIVLDYEVADGRTSEMTEDFLLQFSSMVHAAGKKVILYIDPLTGPSQEYTNINASNANILNNAFDYMTVGLGESDSNIAQSFANQLLILRGGPNGKNSVNYNHLMVLFDLNDATIADAQTVRGLIQKYDIPAVDLFRDQSRQGGLCTTAVNQKTDCLLFGRC